MTATEILELDPEQIAKLKSPDIPLVVSAAVRLDRKIKEDTAFLDTLKLRLIHEGEADAKGQEMKTPGTTWNYTGACGNRASVVFPADKVIGMFWVSKGRCFRKKGKETIEMANLKKMAGEHFKKLFFGMFKPCKAFRELVKVLLPPGKQEEMIAACEEPSSPRVSFETAENGPNTE